MKSFQCPICKNQFYIHHGHYLQDKLFGGQTYRVIYTPEDQTIVETVRREFNWMEPYESMVVFKSDRLVFMSLERIEKLLLLQ